MEQEQGPERYRNSTILHVDLVATDLLDYVRQELLDPARIEAAVALVNERIEGLVCAAGPSPAKVAKLEREVAGLEAEVAGSWTRWPRKRPTRRSRPPSAPRTCGSRLPGRTLKRSSPAASIPGSRSRMRLAASGSSGTASEARGGPHPTRPPAVLRHDHRLLNGAWEKG